MSSFLTLGAELRSLCTDNAVLSGKQ
uniref:Uncharacterized protein n=1 Tax=Anguilla anguilla TaxID=7936 RepID=A0A0E9Y2L2_ANGAN